VVIYMAAATFGRSEFSHSTTTRRFLRNCQQSLRTVYIVAVAFRDVAQQYEAIQYHLDHDNPNPATFVA
jgi:hypothetical protein